MLVTLMRKNVINKIVLPEISQENCWIYGNNFEKLIQVEKYNNKWQIKSNKYVKILNRK